MGPQDAAALTGTKAGLKFCTITGADDNTDIADMQRLSAKYPFVEWGILFGSQSGTPRFPGDAWLRKIADLNGLNFSAHLCGKYLRAQLAGSPLTMYGHYQRAQLNWHGTKWVLDAPAMHRHMLTTGKQYIFQLDGVNDAHLQAARTAGVNAVGIFDTSHGAGIVPNVWPQPLPGILCTYSGGLGPANIDRELLWIDKTVGEVAFCIDMETHVRTQINNYDYLDMDKVELCLAEAAKYVVAK